MYNCELGVLILQLYATLVFWILTSLHILKKDE